MSWKSFDDVRTLVFMDGNNFYATIRNIRQEKSQDIDYKKLQECMAKNAQLVRIYYYTSIRENNRGESTYNSIRPLLDYLQFNRYTIVTKAAKVYEDKDSGIQKVKGNMDIELVTDMLLLAHAPNPVEQIVLFSGDGDFTYTLEAIKRLGIRTVVVSAVSMASDDLRRTADEFVEITTLEGIWKEAKDRGEPDEYIRKLVAEKEEV